MVTVEVSGCGCADGGQEDFVGNAIAKLDGLANALGKPCSEAERGKEAAHAALRMLKEGGDAAKKAIQDLDNVLAKQTFLYFERPSSMDAMLAAEFVSSGMAECLGDFVNARRWLTTVQHYPVAGDLVSLLTEQNKTEEAEATAAAGGAVKTEDNGKAAGTATNRYGVAFDKGDGSILRSTGDVESKKVYYGKRIKLFENYYERTLAKKEAAEQKGEKIAITMPDGSIKEGIAGVTTGMDIAKSISKGLAKKSLVCKVDDEGWDLDRPFVKDCSLRLCTWDDDEGKETFWHSSAHILGQILELDLGVDLTIGPTLENGFYYDCFLGERTLHDEDLKRIEKKMAAAGKENQPFQRAIVNRDEALSMFQENKFKIEIINGLPEDAEISIYRVGPMVDLCSGPHLPHSGLMAKSVWINQASRSFWRADVKREHLMRIYGITFPDDKLMKQHKHRIEEAKKRDHRLIGVTHDLFFFNPISPGSCFFTPYGARIYLNLMTLIREKYWEYKYNEVITPNIFNFKLWETSGHAGHYKANMFHFNIENEEFGMKPMNCPGHCMMFKERARSYRDLPWRVADFGVLHRNEFSGSLHGLTRVRRFQQDDAHIFCRHDQVQTEIRGFLRMLDEVYGVFGLTYELNLSTRPDDYLGEIEMWNEAEGALQAALNDCGRPWSINEGDGAFYGPKIDIIVFDALHRRFQCATVQLDFQLPIRFDLKYMREAPSTGDNSEEKYARPVIVHRAVLGSVERMLAILTEHYAAKWPMWLNPRQVMLVPVSEKFVEYANTVRDKLDKAKIFVEVDNTDRKMQKKVREAQISQFNYILVVGQEEMDSETVNVRTRDNVVHGAMPIEKLMDYIVRERDLRSMSSPLGAEAAAAAAVAKTSIQEDNK